MLTIRMVTGHLNGNNSHLQFTITQKKRIEVVVRRPGRVESVGLFPADEQDQLMVDELVAMLSGDFFLQ